MRMKKFALLGLASLGIACLPSCGSGGWKSDAKTIYVKAGGISETYKSSQTKTKGVNEYYYTTELRYLEEEDSIMVKEIHVAWIAATYAVSSDVTRMEFTQKSSSEAVSKYAHASWIIEYKEQ